MTPWFKYETDTNICESHTYLTVRNAMTDDQAIKEYLCGTMHCHGANEG